MKTSRDKNSKHDLIINEILILLDCELSINKLWHQPKSHLQAIFFVDKM